MFEQSILTNGPAGKKAWTTMLGFTGQVALVSLAVMAPMVFPQVLPLAKLQLSLVPPVPPGPKPLGGEVKQQVARTRVTRTTGWRDLFVTPTRVPDKVIMITDVPSTSNTVVGVPEGNSIGKVDGILGGLMREAATDNAAHLLPPPIAKTVTKAVAAPEPVPTIRYREGGRVQLGKVLQRGELVYPPMAKATRTMGDVVLECVVGPEGRISEVKVKSGNPFLVKAAVEAAWKWIYEPSRLNGDPIEIITLMTFHFTLN